MTTLSRLFRPVLVGLAALLLSAASSAQTIVSCPLGGGGDQITRGFYLLNYPGSILGTVQLTYYTDGTAGTYTISLTAHAATYDGPILGTQSFTADLPSGATTHTFDFGGLPVTPGSTIAFVQTPVAAPGIVYYDTGPCDLGAKCASCLGVIETEDTAPPLSIFRRASIGLTVAAGAPVPAAAVPTLERRFAAILAVSIAAIALLLLRRAG
jgi:hypothetical protein